MNTDTVTIPRAEYDRLLKAAEELEDLLDARIAREIMDRIARGEEETIPAAYVDRLLDGEHPLRVWRDYRGLTQAALAEASGVNRVYIAEIEGRKKPGSVKALRALASALRVDLDDLA